MSDRVYLVWEYSEDLLAIFDDEQKAQDFVREMGYSFLTIDAWPVNRRAEAIEEIEVKK